MLCLLRPLYTFSSVRTLSSTYHNAVHKSHETKHPITSEYSKSGGEGLKKGFVKTNELFRNDQSNVSQSDSTEETFISTNNNTEHISHDKKQQMTKRLKMPAIIPKERTIPSNMKRELDYIISDMSLERKKLLKQLTSSKASIAANLRPRVDLKEQAKQEKGQGIEFLLERDEKTKEEMKRKPLSSNILADIKLLSHLPSLYHISHAIITEIKKRDPNFTPHTMLDVGGNLGSTIWAVNGYYSKSVIDYVWYEKNTYEQHLGIKLFGKYSPHIPNITRKGRYSFPRNGEYDIITAVNHFSSLLPTEMGTQLKTLWSMADNYLIIAENTTQFSSSIMSKLRSQFCNRMEGGHIFAPCPHMFKCPLAASNLKKPCQTVFMAENEVKAYTPKNLIQNNIKHQKVKFTYLVLKKGEKTGREFSRLLSAPNPISTNMIQFNTCNSDGTMSYNDVSKKYAVNLWNHLNHRKEGDVISANWVNHPTKFRSLGWNPEKKKWGERKPVRKNEETFQELDSEDDDDAVVGQGLEEVNAGSVSKSSMELFDKFSESINRNDEMEQMLNEDGIDEIFDGTDEIFDNHLDHLDIIEKSK